MANMINESVTNTAKSQKLLKKYNDRIALAESFATKKGLDMSYERKLATAICLENTSRHIRAMESISSGSAVQPSNIG